MPHANGKGRRWQPNAGRNVRQLAPVEERIRPDSPSRQFVVRIRNAALMMQGDPMRHGQIGGSRGHTLGQGRRRHRSESGIGRALAPGWPGRAVPSSWRPRAPRLPTNYRVHLLGGRGGRGAGLQALPLQVDVRDENQIEAMVAATLRDSGGSTFSSTTPARCTGGASSRLRRNDSIWSWASTPALPCCVAGPYSRR